MISNSDCFDSKTEEFRGHKIVVRWHYDNDCSPPWELEDGHGPVSKRAARDKRPGEMVLQKDRWGAVFYDFQKAIAIAKRDGWGIGDDQKNKLAKQLGRQPTQGEIARESVQHDFDYLRRWCSGEWFWCGYTIAIENADYQNSLWGIDSDSRQEMEAEAISNAKAWLENELHESQDAACRDIATITP